MQTPDIYKNLNFFEDIKEKDGVVTTKVLGSMCYIPC